VFQFARIFTILGWVVAWICTGQALAVDGTPVSPEHVATLSPDEARAAVDAIFDEYIAAMQARCTGAAPGDACLNEQYAASLDPAGRFASFCRIHADDKEYRFCIIIAAESTPMVASVGGNLEQDIDWSNIDDMNNAAREQFMKSVLPKCGQRKACIIERMTSLLALPPAVAESCQEHAKFVHQLNCISDALSISVYRRAIDSGS
jgi:hypothetical protein